MICQECLKRSVCQGSCAKLDQELEKVIGYLREDLIEPELAQKLLEDPVEIFPKDPMEWIADLLNLKETVSSLEEPQRSMIEGYFWEGKGIKELAGESGVSRTQVFRRLEQGISDLRERLSGKFNRQKGIPFGRKFGYNSRAENGQDQEEGEPEAKADPGSADGAAEGGCSGSGRGGAG